MRTHDFSIKIVLLNHHNINCSRILEGEKAETSGATGCSVTHDGALEDLAKLREIVLKRF